MDILGERTEKAVTEDKEDQRVRVRNRTADLLDDWAKIARVKHEKGGSLRYQAYEDGTGPFLLRNPLDPELERMEKIERQFKAHRSLRDVEPATNLWLKQLNGIEIEAEEVD